MEREMAGESQKIKMQSASLSWGDMAFEGRSRLNLLRQAWERVPEDDQKKIITETVQRLNLDQIPSKEEAENILKLQFHSMKSQTFGSLPYPIQFALAEIHEKNHGFKREEYGNVVKARFSVKKDNVIPFRRRDKK